MDKIKEFSDAMGDKIGAKIERKGRFYFEVTNENLRDVVGYLFNEMGCRLSTATAAELYGHIEVLYHFSHDPSGTYFCPRVIMKDKKNPKMNSITPVVRGAEWIEREMFDFWGIEFIDHPRPLPLLSRDHPKGLGKPLRFRSES